MQDVLFKFLFAVLVGAWLVDTVRGWRGRRRIALPVVVGASRWLMLLLGGGLLGAGIGQQDVRRALLGGALIVLASLGLAIKPLARRLEEQTSGYQRRRSL